MFVHSGIVTLAFFWTAAKAFAEDDIFVCPAGYVFCLEELACVPDVPDIPAENKKEQHETCVVIEPPASAKPMRDFDAAPVTCPPGTMYCIMSHMCVRDEVDSHGGCSAKKHENQESDDFIIVHGRRGPEPPSHPIILPYDQTQQNQASLIRPMVLQPTPDQMIVFSGGATENSEKPGEQIVITHSSQTPRPLLVVQTGTSVLIHEENQESSGGIQISHPEATPPPYAPTATHVVVPGVNLEGSGDIYISYPESNQGTSGHQTESSHQQTNENVVEQILVISPEATPPPYAPTATHVVVPGVNQEGSGDIYISYPESNQGTSGHQTELSHQQTNENVVEQILVASPEATPPPYAPTATHVVVPRVNQEGSGDIYISYPESNQGTSGHQTELSHQQTNENVVEQILVVSPEATPPPYAPTATHVVIVEVDHESQSSIITGDENSQGHQATQGDQQTADADADISIVYPVQTVTSQIIELTEILGQTQKPINQDVGASEQGQYINQDPTVASTPPPPQIPQITITDMFIFPAQQSSPPPAVNPAEILTDIEVDMETSGTGIQSNTMSDGTPDTDDNDTPHQIQVTQMEDGELLVTELKPNGTILVQTVRSSTKSPDVPQENDGNRQQTIDSNGNGVGDISKTPTEQVVLSTVSFHQQQNVNENSPEYENFSILQSEFEEYIATSTIVNGVVEVIEVAHVTAATPKPPKTTTGLTQNEAKTDEQTTSEEQPANSAQESHSVAEQPATDPEDQSEESSREAGKQESEHSLESQRAQEKSATTEIQNSADQNASSVKTHVTRVNVFGFDDFNDTSSEDFNETSSEEEFLHQQQNINANSVEDDEIINILISKSVEQTSNSLEEAHHGTEPPTVHSEDQSQEVSTENAKEKTEETQSAEISTSVETTNPASDEPSAESQEETTANTEEGSHEESARQTTQQPHQVQTQTKTDVPQELPTTAKAVGEVSHEPSPTKTETHQPIRTTKAPASVSEPVQPVTEAPKPATKPPEPPKKSEPTEPAVTPPKPAPKPPTAPAKPNKPTLVQQEEPESAQAKEETDGGIPVTAVVSGAVGCGLVAVGVAVWVAKSMIVKSAAVGTSVVSYSAVGSTDMIAPTPIYA